MCDPTQRRRGCEGRVPRKTRGEQRDSPCVQMPYVVSRSADPRTEHIADHRQVRNEKECEEPYPAAVRARDRPKREHQKSSGVGTNPSRNPTFEHWHYLKRATKGSRYG